MDTLDFGNISYNELYKLHTGHAVYDSDSDSSDSTSSSFFEKNKPPLYSFKELKDNSVEPSSTQSETGLNTSDSDGSNKVLGTGFQPQQIITKELEKLVLQNSCILCNVIDRTEHDIRGHRNERAHKKVVEQYIKDRMEILQSGKNVERVYNSGSSQSSSFTSITITSSKLTPNSTEALLKPDNEKTQEEKEQEKLKKLMLPTYCYVCGADLPHSNNAFSHYNSMRHKNNVREWKDKSLDEILQEKLDTFIWSDYCGICYASLPQMVQAQSHYSSKRHKGNVDIWKSTELERLQPSRIDNFVPICQSNGPKTDIKTVKPNIDPLCMVCGINVGTGLQEHYQSDLHKRSVEKFCFVCNIRIISKEQLAEHVKSAWHMKNLEIKNTDNDNLAISQTIVKPVVKKGELSSMEPAIQSTECIHQGKIESSQTTQVFPKSVLLRWRYCDVCKVSLNGTEQAESHYKEASHIIKKISFSCRICELTYNSKSEMDFHVKSFPHNQVSKLKSLVVSKGISTQEFWVFDESEIWCSLCGVSMQSNSSAVDHLRSKRHVNKFNIWCFEQSKDAKDPNRRWYFCNVCHIKLDGTTFVELHYQGQHHAEQYKKQASDQQKSATSKSREVTNKEKTENLDKGQNEVLNNRDQPSQKTNDLSTEVTNSNKVTSNHGNTNQQREIKETTEIATFNNEVTKVSNKTFTDDKDILYCYVCKKQFNSLVDLNIHIGSYPHNYIAKYKSLVVSKGIITQQFWDVKESTIWCSFCQTSLSCTSLAFDHFASKRHMDNFNTWCQLQPKDTKDPNIKWYFCDLCNEFLDGTSNAEYHYQGKTHDEKQKNYLKSLQTSPLTSRPTHISKTDSASDSNTQDNSYVLYNDTNRNYSTLNTTKILQNKDESPSLLQNQVQSEMEKIKSIIKSIPPNTALTFLQKYVKELENLKEEPKAVTINVKDVVTRDVKNVFENKSFIKNRFEHGSPEEHRYVGPDKLDLHNVSEPKTPEYSLATLLILGAAGMLILYYFKKYVIIFVFLHVICSF